MVILRRFAGSIYEAGRQRVDTFNRWPVWQEMRRGFQAPIYRISDTGLFGLTPLKTHILICGFPASGTTLMQLMLENGLPQARRFGKERSGWKAATYSLRNHPIVISKLPHDVFRLDPLRVFYATRKAELKIILMSRDPRDLMTSERTRANQRDYCGSPEDWRRYYIAFQRERNSPDVMVMRYEDLVGKTAEQQQKLEEFVGYSMAVPFEKFASVSRSDFDTTTLCGLRPVEAGGVSRWTDACHFQRMNDIIARMPELPTALKNLGYEEDEFWLESYRSSQSSPVAIA